MSVDAKYHTTATASGGGRDGRTALADGTMFFDLVIPKELGGPGGAGANPEKLFALGFSARLLDQPTSEDNRFEKRFDDEMAAELLHDDQVRQNAFAETSKIFRKRRRQQAELGNRVPMLSAPALLGRDDLASCFKIVLVTEEPLKAAPQKLLFVCKLNVHLRLV